MDLLKDNIRSLYFKFLIPSLGSAMVMSIYPNRAMAGVICGGILNIILDIVFVFPLQMGIAGAAFASALGMLLQVLVGGSHFFSKKNEMKFVMPVVEVLVLILSIFWVREKRHQSRTESRL